MFHWGFDMGSTVYDKPVALTAGVQLTVLSFVTNQFFCFVGNGQATSNARGKFICLYTAAVKARG